MAVFPVILDANVLYNAAVRDTLLRAAAIGLYRVHWSPRILDEAFRNMLADARLKSPEAAARLRAQLRTHFPEAQVEPADAQIDAMKNDPDDRHVAAAAVLAHAQVIVTFNTRHFPDQALEPYGIEAQHPDEFLCHLLDLAPSLMRQVLGDQAAALRMPPMTVHQLLVRLAKDAPMFAEQARRLFPKAGEATDGWRW